MREDDHNLVPAVSSQSKIAVMKQHKGSAVLLTEQILKDATSAQGTGEFSAEHVLARPWSWVFQDEDSSKRTPHANVQESTCSILLSEVSLGIDDGQGFHFETVNELKFRVLIAPFFGPSVLSDAVRYHSLLVPLVPETIHLIGEKIIENPELEIEIDLENLVVQVPGEEPIGFETDQWLRNRLLFGLDEPDELRLYRSDAKEARAQAKADHPWLYNQTDDSELD